MSWIYKFTTLLLCLLSFSLYGDSGYFFCIEGGGSKTILQVVNQKGQIVSLIQDGIQKDKIETTGSNINLIGPDGIRQVLSALFDRIFIVEEGQQTDCESLISDSRIIAGMAGASLFQNKQTLTLLFEEKGISCDHVIVMSDAEMALQLIPSEGIILVSGTGSVCLGKKEEAFFRVGGLGRILGDEGSGYQIGLQALKATLAEDYGWGMPTSLTPALKEYFQVSDLKTLVPKISLGEMSPSKIASSAPLVFRHSWDNDKVAEEIINQAANDLGDLLINLLDMSDLLNCEVHLWGGVFKNTLSESFIHKIKERLPETYRHLNIINRSNENPAVLFAIQKFSKSL